MILPHDWRNIRDFLCFSPQSLTHPKAFFHEVVNAPNAQSMRRILVKVKIGGKGAAILRLSKEVGFGVSRIQF